MTMLRKEVGGRRDDSTVKSLVLILTLPDPLHPQFLCSSLYPLPVLCFPLHPYSVSIPLRVSFPNSPTFAPSYVPLSVLPTTLYL